MGALFSRGDAPRPPSTPSASSAGVSPRPASEQLRTERQPPGARQPPHRARFSLAPLAAAGALPALRRAIREVGVAYVCLR